MRHKIIWSPAIFLDVEKLIDYLRRAWPAAVTENFYEIFTGKIDLLASGVLKGRSTQKDKAIQSILITKHNRLYFEIRDDSIHLLRLIDTRQNPVKNPYE